MEKLVLTVDTSRKTKALGDLFGIFFEDLNHAADGGLYAEMVRNRSFEFDPADHPTYHAMTAWKKVARGDAIVLPHVETAHPLNEKNPHYLTVEITRAGDGGGVLNEGYAGGMWVEQGKRYHFSCWYFRQSRAMAPIHVLLETEEGEVVAGPVRFMPESREWTKVTLDITAKATGAARLLILSEGVQTFCLDMVSLFPEETFCLRENGLRKDIATLLADMKPKFMRFPGGCLLHCGSLSSDDRCSQYRWKNTLGPVERRPARRNSWGYNQTLGLGYYEFFCLCEDIGAQPLPVISAGWDPHTLRATPIEDMQEWIDEALDLVEFARGGTDTHWGGIRAAMGHPAPFQLKYLAIGNEEVGEPFHERFRIIHRAVKKRYPDLMLIGSAGASCGGEVFQRGWEVAREEGSSFVDEHYYQSTTWLKANMHRYDAYPTDGPKAFLGEYASQDDKYDNALVEAAYMTCMEKAPGLGMACYAPMLCNVHYVNWKPNMIWFDDHRAYGSACYQVQKLFMNHQGDHELYSSLDRKSTKVEELVSGHGGIRFHAEDEIELTNIVLTNTASGEVRHYDEFRLNGTGRDHPLCSTDWEAYTLAFTAVRHANETAEYPKALEVYFGVCDEANYMKWIIDGWTQVSSLATIQDGKYSDQGMYYAPAPYDQAVDYLLTVDHGHIMLSVNGVCHAKLKTEKANVDALYYAVSVEEATGNVLLKAVNLQKDTVQLQLDSPELIGCFAEQWQMADHSPEDANSFEAPDKVAPTKKQIAALPEQLILPPESITVYRVHV